jgi:hypothetical protein
MGQGRPGRTVTGDDPAGGVGKLPAAGVVVDLLGHAVNLALRY